jgi:hypothetical protein
VEVRGAGESQAPAVHAHEPTLAPPASPFTSGRVESCGSPASTLARRPLAARSSGAKKLNGADTNCERERERGERLAHHAAGRAFYANAVQATEQVAIRTVRGFWWEMSSRGRFARSADFPRHDCSPYSHVHVRRESLGFAHRSRTIFCRPVPNPTLHRCRRNCCCQADGAL